MWSVVVVVRVVMEVHFLVFVDVMVTFVVEGVTRDEQAEEMV